MCITLFAYLSVALIEAASRQVHADQQAIQGKWVIESFSYNGRNLPADDFKNVQLEIRGNKNLILQDGGVASRTFRLDPAKKPKAMDITYDDGPNKGKTNHAIYVIDGDRLKICRHEQPEMERPKRFAAEAGSNRALIIWKRVKSSRD